MNDNFDVIIRVNRGTLTGTTPETTEHLACISDRIERTQFGMALIRHATVGRTGIPIGMFTKHTAPPHRSPVQPRTHPPVRDKQST